MATPTYTVNRPFVAVSLAFFALVFAGESTLDFLFDFVEMSQGPMEAFAALETRPRSGNEIC